ncbi:MAG: TIGR04255 family protein, partial [Actinobacteria bacterium]|nr:TIGR04255 family protein [Actinomycetota bacterium]
AVERILEPDGIARLGIRYIDEIRVPQSEISNPWDGWIDNSLLAPTAEGLVARAWASAVQYETGDDRRLVLRYGPADGPVVDPSGPLKRPNVPPSGPVFILDFDSFWQPTDIPAFSAADLAASCDDLRAPVRTLFDQLISQRLIDEVFKREGQ